MKLILLCIYFWSGVDGGKWYEKKAGGSTGACPVSCPPESSPTTGWKPFPTADIPAMFNNGHVYHWLVESLSNAFSTNDSDSEEDDGYASTDKPLKKGQALLVSGFVGNLQDNVEGGIYYLRGEVQHSMTFRKQAPLNVTVQLSMRSGSVLRAQCQCKASALMRCAHVAAVLMSLEKHVTNEGHTVNAPSTSLPCVWNQGRKRKNNPQPVHQAQYSIKRSKFKSHWFRSTSYLHEEFVYRGQEWLCAWPRGKYLFYFRDVLVSIW